MAVNQNDKVFVVNADTNTQYGGVDPTGQFVTIGELAPQPYKVYTALLTQSGESNSQSITGALTKGVTYYFTEFSVPSQPWDFSNVGGPIYPNTNSFVATSSDYPNSYGSAYISYNTGAPVATVLENTLDDQLYWTYYGTGTYIAHSERAMLSGNVGVLFGQTNTAIVTTKMYVPTKREMWIETFSDINSYSDDLLNNTLVEIRAYN